MPTDDTFAPALAPSRLVSYVNGVGSTAAHTASSVTSGFANVLTSAGWELVDPAYADTGGDSVVFWDGLTVTAPTIPVTPVPVTCGSSDLFNFLGIHRTVCDGDAYYWLPYDPWRQAAVGGSSCTPFAQGTTVASTISNLEAAAQFSGLWTVTLHPERGYGQCTFSSLVGGTHGNGVVWASNGRNTSVGRTWGGGYILRSAASNTGARIYLKITEYIDWHINFASTDFRSDIVVLHMDVAISASGPWHTFSLELTPRDTEECPPALRNPLWTYKVIANPYQCFILGHGNSNFDAYDATCNDGQKALFACGVPWVDTAHSGSIQPAWATGDPDRLNGVRGSGSHDDGSAHTSFMCSTFWNGIYSWNGGDFIEDSRAVTVGVPMSIFEPLRTRNGNAIAGHAWVGMADPSDNRMKIVGKLWDGIYVSSGAYDLQGVSSIEGYPVHLVSRQRGEDFDHIMNNSIWVIGA